MRILAAGNAACFARIHVLQHVAKVRMLHRIPLSLMPGPERQRQKNINEKNGRQFSKKEAATT